MSDNMVLILLVATCISALLSFVFLFLGVRRHRLNKKARAKENKEGSQPLLKEKEPVLLLETGDDGDENIKTEAIEILKKDETKKEPAPCEDADDTVYNIDDLKNIIKDYNCNEQ